MRIYKGEFQNNIREGNGLLIYMNYDTLEGNFHHGQPHGTMVYTFASTGKIRFGKYLRGDRIEWIQTQNMKQSYAVNTSKEKKEKNSKSISKKMKKPSLKKSTSFSSMKNENSSDSESSPKRDRSIIKYSYSSTSDKSL